MMSRKILLFLTAALALVATGCLKPELSLRFDLAADVNSTYRIVYYASDSREGRVVESAVNVSGGKGAEKCRTAKPTMIWVFVPGNRVPAIGIYAERGDEITVSGTKRDPLTWNVAGNGLNEEWSQWRQKNIKALQSGLSERINKAVADYVTANTDNPLSVALMLTAYRRSADEAGYLRLWNMIDHDAKEEELIAAIGRADQLTVSPVEAPPAVKELKLHCMGETIINVAPKNRVASLLYFWRGDERGRRADIDSIKSLSHRYDGDTRLQTIDIALSQDSMSWLGNARRDSVVSGGQWLRAWAPGGRLHSSIAMLQVAASPWFIVLDKRGVQVYRGKEYKDAAKAVGKMLGAPERASDQ